MSNDEGPCGEGETFPPQQKAKSAGGAAPPLLVPMIKRQLFHRGAKKPSAGNVVPLVPGADASRPSSIPLIIWNNQIYDASSRQLKTKVNKQGVKKKRTMLVVVPEALEMLKKVSKPVAVLGICGPARSGKSYILSKMLGCPDAFALGHTFDPETFGIWLGTSYLDCGDHAMLLLDTEGVHAVDAKGEDDIRILVMTVLLSSFLIYNSRSSFESRDMDTMRCFTKLANAIVVNTKSSGETEKEGGASKQSTEDTNKEYRQRFPDFLWLLRDVILDIPHGKKNDHVYVESDDEDDEENAEEDDGKDTTTPALMTAREFMLHQFRKNEKVGNSIIGLFATVNCVMLPPPGNADALRHVEQSECEQKLDPDFTAKVAKLVVDLQEKVEKKKGFQHVQRVDGTTLADLTEIYLEAVNEAVYEGAQLCLEGSWNSAVEIGCSSLIEKHAKQYDTEMEELLSDKLPLEEVADSQVARDQAQSKMALMQVHSQVLQVKKRSLIDATKYYVPTENAKEWRADLLRRLEFKIIQTKESDDGRKVVTGGILHGFVNKNRELSRYQCVKCFDDLFQPIKAKLAGSHTAKESDASQKRQPYTFNRYMEDRTNLQTEYFKKAVGPAKQDVWKQKLEFIDQFEASVKMLGGYQEREYANKKKLEAKEAEVRKLESEKENEIAEMKRVQNEILDITNKLKKQQDEDIKTLKDDLAAANAKEEARLAAIEKESYVTDVKVIGGDRPAIEAPEGFKKIDVDLNGGALGKYIYLCYKMGDRTNAITGLQIIQGKSTAPPKGYTKLPENLNRGTGGKCLYLCYTRSKEPSPDPIRRLKVIHDIPDIHEKDPAFTRIDVNLNQGGWFKGQHIYICYSHSPKKIL